MAKRLSQENGTEMKSKRMINMVSNHNKGSGLPQEVRFKQLNNSKVINSSSVPSADVTGPILSDLKYRLKQSELEKNRIKKSLTNMTEKNETVQKQLELVKTDLEKAKKKVKLNV